MLVIEECLEHFTPVNWTRFFMTVYLKWATPSYEVHCYVEAL